MLYWWHVKYWFNMVKIYLWQWHLKYWFNMLKIYHWHRCILQSLVIINRVCDLIQNWRWGMNVTGYQSRPCMVKHHQVTHGTTFIEGLRYLSIHVIENLILAWGNLVFLHVRQHKIYASTARNFLLMLVGHHLATWTICPSVCGGLHRQVHAS